MGDGDRRHDACPRPPLVNPKARNAMVNRSRAVVAWFEPPVKPVSGAAAILVLIESSPLTPWR
jgi:hypothetical protein